MSIYNLMMEQSLKYKWPEVYATDLTVHDKLRLEHEDAPQTFGWVLRDYGTELLDLRMRPLDLDAYIEHYKQDGKKNHYSIVQNGRLKEYPFTEWCNEVKVLNQSLYAKDVEDNGFRNRSSFSRY